MKIKRIIIYFLFLLFVFPCFVYAEVCQKDDIKIVTIENIEEKGNIEEISNPTNENNQVNLNTKMNVIGDSITYKVVLKNTSNSDYVFDKNQIEKDYINYEITYDDESNNIKAGEEKVIYLNLSYSNKPQTEQIKETSQVSFNLINDKGDSLINPETGNKSFYIYLIAIILLSIILLKNKKNTLLSVIVITLLLIPTLVKASCTCTLDINLNLEIDAKEAMFLPGNEVNAKMKQLAGDDTSSVTNGYTFQNTSITAVKKSDIAPNEANKEEKNIVSTVDSPYPIYMWYENGTIYWWSEDITPSLNENAGMMFFEITNLNDISGVQTYDSTVATTLIYLFGNCDLSSLRDLSLWNVSQVHNFIAIFRNNNNLETLNGLENWDVSNATNMAGLFNSCTSLSDISSIANWDTSMVINMSSMFAFCESLTDINNIYKWDLSKVQSISSMFGSCTSLSNIKPLKEWKISNVTDMSKLFSECTSLEDLTGLENWDVSRVLDFRNAFYGNLNLQDASSINDWDISKDADFTKMFRGTPTHPEFSNVVGTWTNGTFTPE